MDSFKDVLEAAQLYCKGQMAEPTYNLYIDGLEPVSFEDSSHITLSVRNDFICKIVSDRYLGLLKEAFKSVLGFDVDIQLVVPSTPPHEVVLAQQYDLNPASPQGNYEFTFENFIKGPSNQFAFAAAQAVAANPSGAYNPLFIYGGSGLGKTHLLTAIQIEIKRTHPDFVIMYVTCEQFTNELIAAIRAGSTEDFRAKYRVADLLLVDDIQFIAGKESTQEEFFHTFNSLHDAHKQIVIASDRPAKEIKSLEERLRTRFEWGLTADVQPPDFETRVAIVKRKAELLHLDLPENVAEFIANHLKNNIRQLEGAVKKLNAYYMLEGIQPVISVAQNAIKDILNETRLHRQRPAGGHLYPAGSHRHEHGGHRPRILRPGPLHHRLLPQDHGAGHEKRPAPAGNGGRHHQKRQGLSPLFSTKPEEKEENPGPCPLPGKAQPPGAESSPLFTPSFQHSTFLFHRAGGKENGQTRFHKLSTKASHPGGKAKPLSGKGKSGFSTQSPAPTTFTATSINRETAPPALFRTKPYRDPTGPSQ